MDWSSIRILVVEDSPTQRLMLEEVLTEQGAEVFGAKDGQEGYLMVKEHNPTLVITDIEMPEMNGYELCTKVKQDPSTKNIPIILLTNLSDSQDVIRGIECGADNFLTKPWNHDFLISSIEDAIANRKEERYKGSQPTVELSFKGKRYKIKIDHLQVTDLLLSTYASAIEKNKELEETNRKLSLLHLQLQNKNKELMQLINDKNLLLGIAAHDLRNPLSAISAFSQLLAMKLHDNPDEKIKRMIEMINSSSLFMLQMVNDLLDISAIDAGKLILHLKKTDLFQLVNNNLLLNESLAEQKKITLNFQADPNIPVVICDPQKIEQVMHNLLSNAIKFSHPGSSIDITLRLNETEVVLCVKDRGVGIPEKERSNLFTFFGKTSAKSTAGEPSTGLGLAIVKRIIQALNGRIWVESIEGKGSSFYVALPINQNVVGSLS